MEKKMTGYPSIDKPWLKYYTVPPGYVGQLDNATLYEAYVAANRDNLDGLAIIMMDGGHRYTHRELINMIDLAANGFSKMGIGLNSRVGIMLNNTVEEAVSLLALNKLGALSIFIDVTKSISDIEYTISSSQAQLLIIDEIMMPMEAYVNTNNIPIIIANQTKPSEKGIPFFALYGMEQEQQVKPAVYEKSRPAIMINSSGTTGIPKPIVHSNHSVNMAALKMMCTDYPLGRHNVIMKIIPSYIGLGLITTLYTGLLTGTMIVLIGGNNPHQSIMNTVTFASSFPMFREGVGINSNAKLLMFTAPMYFRILCEKLDIFEDLSYMGAMLAAGSKMGEKELEVMNQQLASRNCPVKICNGYGQNEMCGAVTLNTNSANKPGSAGFPVIGCNVRIVNPETLETLKPNSEGLVVEQSESKFLYYDNLPEETAASMITLPDGTVWFNTKDLGMLDCDGFLYITGRVSRVLVRFDFKLSIDKIEEKIKRHPAVLDCAVVAIRKSEIEEVPVAYIVLNESNANHSIDNVLSQIQKGDEPLSEMEYPAQIVKLSHLPYMKNGKIDYRALERKARNAQTGNVVS